MTDKITLHNMMFYGFHGVHEYEKQHGQRFYVDIEMTVDVRPSALSDNLQDTVDYTQIYEDVKKLVETTHYSLLEALTSKIAEVVLTAEKVIAVNVRVRKPLVPIQGQLDYVEIAIYREKL